MADRLVILLLASSFLTGSLTGCASFLPRHRGEAKDSLAYDVLEVQENEKAKASENEAENSRRPGRSFGKNRGHVPAKDPQAEESTESETAPAEKKKRAPKGFLYGGLSSEAREIEDSLYGN
ncbi:MAG: hypothetical protein IJD43_14460 [Thermoguttaceae bacterium]|nr:hypothetical protein [Planctomycetaceae bacterium]MBQ4144668.1 hypothetical protein [Thermoguttaceae bacterium]